jgi:hypothetical protein
MFCNWWDNPTNPDVWHKHQVGFLQLLLCTSVAVAALLPVPLAAMI